MSIPRIALSLSLFLLLGCPLPDDDPLAFCATNRDPDGDGLRGCEDPDCVPSEFCPAQTQATFDLLQRGPGSLIYAEDREGGSFFGHPTEAGDINGDGLADVVSCALAASDPVRGPQAGVVSIFLSNGVIEGARGAGGDGVVRMVGERQGDLLGAAAHVADFTGDGIGDVLVGAQNSDGFSGDKPDVGAVYLLVGAPNLPAEIDLTQPGDGRLVAIYGERPGDRLGIWMGDADLDGDGIKDLILGADQYDGVQGDREDAGAVYVIKGGADLPAVIDLSLSTPGDGVLLARIQGEEEGDHLGGTLFGGDLDGDGQDDIALAATMNRLSASLGEVAVGSAGGDGPGNTRNRAGDTHLLFGPVAGEIDLATSPAETVVFGAEEGDHTGEEILIADIDGDGAGELLLGGLSASREDAFAVGIMYIIPGGPGLRQAGVIDLRTPPAGVKVILGDEQGELVGDTLAAPDVDGDGIREIAVARPRRTVNRRGNALDDAGRVLILFDVLSLPDFLDLREFPDTHPAVDILGEDEGDTLAYSMTSADVDGDGKEDVIPNAMRGDGINNAVQDAGEIYVISGAKLSSMIGR